MAKKGSKGRVWTDEEKAEAKRKYWERMNPEKLKQMDIEEELAPLEADGGDDEGTAAVTISSEVSTEELLKRALEAIANFSQMQGAQSQTGPNIKNGKLTGTLDRFSTKKSDYTDFTGRLAEDPALMRFGFKENFELTYKWELVRYQTIDGVWMQEPKITIDLNRKIYNDETGELTSGRYKEFRIVIHEDPDTAIYVARANGIDVPEDPESETGFLNEMRYLQVRDWLLECFMPKRPTSHSNRREMVVNGKLVEYFETNSEDSAKLPFDQLGSKL